MPVMDPPFPSLNTVPLPSPERWLVPLAALLAIRALTLLQNDPAAVAETRFLALLVAGVLVTIAALCAPAARAPELAGTALLATAASWIAYHGPSRGAVVTLILALGLALAFGRAWRDRIAAPQGPDLSLTVPVAVGLQLLLRGDLLLPPLLDTRTVVSLLALPVAAGGAIWVLGARFGERRALIAAAAALLPAPGWNVTSTLGIVALAAGASLADGERPRSIRALAGAALLLMPLWNLPLGILFALTGLAAASRRWTSFLAPMAGAAVIWLAAAPGGWRVALDEMAGGLLILPALLLAPAADRWRAVSGVLLALWAMKLGPGPEAMAAGLALAALATPIAGAAAGLQRAWCGLLVAGSALLASYPWTRSEPLGDLLALFGLDRRLPALALLAVAALALGWTLDHLRERAPSRRAWLASPVLPALVVLLLAGLAVAREAAPTTVAVDSYRAVALDGSNRYQRVKFPAQPVSALVLDTNLVHGAGLAPGTTVAILELRDERDAVLDTWRLHAGEDTAEWAASRPDVAAQPGFRAPPSWISRLAPDGTFFARRFRARLEAESGAPAASVMIQIAGHLSPELRLVIYRLELRR